MKIELGALFTGIMFSLLNNNNVYAHPFTVCPNTVDHLHISQISFTPDPPKGGHDFSATIVLKPDTQLNGGKANLVAKVLGLKIINVDLDICTYIDCPLKANNEAKLTFKYPLPAEVPSNVEVNVQVTIHDLNNQMMSCITTKVDTMKDNNKPIDMKKYLKSTIDFLNDNEFGNKQSVLFMYKLWLEQFHKSAELDWYPIHELDDPATKETKKQMFESKLIIFAENLARIVGHNKRYRIGEVSYAMGLNDFAHLHNKEFADQYLSGYVASLKPNNNNKKSNPISKAWNFLTDKASSIIRIPNEIFNANNPKKINVKDNLPAEFDWVTKGAVTPVKNQGSCGSCWAFSAIQALEGAYFLKYGELKLFSEQQLVSCERDCYGCSGGLMDIAFEWIKRNGGVCTEKDYPYTSGASGMNGFCRASKCTVDSRTEIKEIVDVEHTETSLMAAVVKQPVSIAIEADQYAFQFYSHGVLTQDCGDHLDHGVLLTGYGTLDNIPFWKIKNSWGPNWGMSGYILIERGKQVPTGDEECGILANPSYPVL